MKLDKLDQVFFLKKPLRKVMDGHLFDEVFGWVLRGLAFFMAFFLVLKSIEIWRATFFFMGEYSHPDFLKVLNTLISQLIWIAVYFGYANVLWYRGSDILLEENDPDYNATPNLVLILKAIGECYAFNILGLFTIGAFSTWLIGNSKVIAPVTQRLNLAWLLPYLPRNPFLLGLVILLAGPVLAILCVLVVYAGAEILGALVSIARNTEKKK